MRSRPIARCMRTTAATCATRSSAGASPSGNGRLPTWVVRILCVPRPMATDVLEYRRTGSVGRVLDHRVGFELGVLISAADLLGSAQVNVVHDFARCRIDSDRSARAFPGGALHRLDQPGPVGV